MFRPCGRAPSYSGKLIARAIELYLKGVEPGCIRWHELQSTLEMEFPKEFKVKGQDKPSPETVMAWVRKYPDLPEKLKQLRVQEAAPGQTMPGIPSYAFSHQPQLSAPILYASITPVDIAALFRDCIAFMAMTIMVRVAWSLARTQ